MSLEALSAAISTDAGIRRIAKLQPVGGRGDKVFPPTYPGDGRNEPPRHVFERRRVAADDGASADVWCVLIDSVQSQANRLEEALRDAADEGLPLPFVTVDFSKADLAPLTRITSLDAPHRVYDAILRDSRLGSEPFMRSAPGQRLAAAKAADATALLELSPTALLFGAWHSQGEGGGLGAKFERRIVSEIVGVGVPVDEVTDRRTGEVSVHSSARRGAVRIDPLGILSKVKVFKGEEDWSADKLSAGKGAKEKKPSEINHSNIIAKVQPLGVTFDHAEHRLTLSLAGLRRLRFGGGERDTAGRALIAALGLVAVVEQDARGYALRSRCELVREGAAPLEIVDADGVPRLVALDREAARKLYREAYDRACAAGFAFASLTLEPQEKLIEIVRRSRELALAGAGGGDDADDE
ncbi:MAG: type I-U CRISPR-associated protein Cas7 [Rhodobacteraceae bacterium]|nr:MAG: type I-U CRISPR-associated protein Cas7 [Paracoccaceae bacterium]